jgi:putative flippase GtrA
VTSGSTRRPSARSWTASRARTLLKETGAFGVVGGLTFLLDVGLFQLLYAQVGAGAVTAKFVSTVVATTVAYVGHRFWSFSHRGQTSVRRGYALFVAINAATLLLGLAVVAVVRYPLHQDDALVLQAANVGSIVVGSVIRWLSYRRWVFPARAPRGVAAETA